MELNKISTIFTRKNTEGKKQPVFAQERSIYDSPLSFIVKTITWVIDIDQELFQQSTFYPSDQRRAVVESNGFLDHEWSFSLGHIRRERNPISFTIKSKSRDWDEQYKYV